MMLSCNGTQKASHHHVWTHDKVIGFSAKVSLNTAPMMHRAGTDAGLYPEKYMRAHLSCALPFVEFSAIRPKKVTRVSPIGTFPFKNSATFWLSSH